MNGRERCEILREIRREIARSNELPLNTPECTHGGDCPGTCPMCESELKYLETALKKREREGKPIRLGDSRAEIERVLQALTEIPSDVSAGTRVELDGLIASPDEESSW